MSSIKTEGIVLRRAEYGEASCMLTLLTPDGLLSASARGSRKGKSKTLVATELFTAGEYLFSRRGDRYTLTSFGLKESFYPIRADVDRLAHGAYWLGLCEAMSQPGEDAHRLFRMLLLSLAVLAYSDVPPRALTAVFLAQFAMLGGFAPRLDVCARCGRVPPGVIRFDARRGGICCSACAGGGDPVSLEALHWMRHAQTRGAFMLAGREALPKGDVAVYEEAMRHFNAHVKERVDRRIPSGEML